MTGLDKYWEEKLSPLLVPPLFPWKHKCPDIQHGGQAKLDFYTFGHSGQFYAIEVKSVTRQERRFNVEWHKKGDEGPTPLQRQQLDILDDIPGCTSIVAIGYNKEVLYFARWRDIKNLAITFLDNHKCVIFVGKTPATSEDVQTALDSSTW